MDFTYLNMLNVGDLLTQTRRLINELAPSVKDHAMRALADRLEEYSDAYNVLDRLQADVDDAERRAASWREEAQALQRQLDQARG